MPVLAIVPTRRRPGPAVDVPEPEWAYA